MRRPELDYLLTTMLDSQPEVSDLLFTVDKALQVESFGELKPVACEPPIPQLTPFQTEMVALNLMGDNLWHIADLLRRGSCDTAYTLTDKARFRISIFSQRGNYSIVLRKLNTVIPTLESLSFPEIIKQIPREKTGLVLVTGATGSGKSTTLAAILNEISHTRPVHIITLEDPVEFVHPHDVATFNPRLARRSSPSAQGHSRWGNARPRDHQNRPKRRRDGPPRAQHLAHDRRRPDHQSYLGHVRDRRTGTAPRTFG
jgi:twitching motility protein PilT